MLRKEHEELEKEVIILKKEAEKLKRKIDYHEMADIEKAKTLSALKSYLKNNVKIENLKLIQDVDNRSGKFANLDDYDIASLAYYDEFLKQD